MAKRDWRGESDLVCSRCGLAVYSWVNSYKHASGGAIGAMPAKLKHKPEPIERAEYERREAALGAEFRNRRG